MKDEPQVVFDNVDEPEFRVAVVVFADVHAVDYGDASGVVERAVFEAMRNLRFEQTCERFTWSVPIEVADVQEIGRALGNGAVLIFPSKRVYRYSGRVDHSGGLPPEITDPWERKDG